VKKFQNVQTVANAIRLSRRALPNKTALLLEGTKDRRLYSNWVDSDRCQPYPVDGRDNVLELLRLLKAERMPGVLALVDRDHDYLDSRTSYDENMIVSRTRDMEGMLLQSSALEKVLHEYQTGTTFVTDSIRPLLVRLAQPLGYLRWISFKNGWALDFKKLRYRNFIDRDKRECRVPEMCREVIFQTRGFARSGEELEAEINRAFDARHDPWQVAQGHDLVGVLAALLSSPAGQIAREDLERGLRLAFSEEHFKSAPLFDLICAWQRRNPPFVVLRLPCP